MHTDKLSEAAAADLVVSFSSLYAYRIIISFIFSDSFVGSFLVLGLSLRARDEPRQQRDTVKKA